MAFADTYQTPDLASILRTLAGYAPPPHQTPFPSQPPVPYQPPPSQPLPDLEEGEEYDPSTFQPSLAPPLQQSQPLPPRVLQPTTTPTPPPQPSPSSKASHITTWPPALRHTTLLLSTSPSITSRLRHLITSAHTHERQWHTGREALVRQLTTRSTHIKELDTVLSRLGGNTTSTTNNNNNKFTASADAVDVDKELRVYDKKVYKAYGEMVIATGVELERLGIPFFAIGETEKGRVGEEELERLKGRMVEFLEDMVRE
ncbi:MAG: hypothetical protein Q9208_003516 [Pyrenodesmia sp. 3 TL-2023]